MTISHDRSTLPTVVDGALVRPALRADAATRYCISADEDLLPPPAMMLREEIDSVLEDWLAWGVEWTLLLRAFGGLRASSRVLDLGCGLGRVAFPLRRALVDGTYDGVDVVREKIDFLRERFTPRYPAFRFHLLDVANTAYNPGGAVAHDGDISLPFDDRSFDVVIGASLFTHLVPITARRYLAEIGRLLADGGRCTLSLFLLDVFDEGRPRTGLSAGEAFSFAHRYTDEAGAVAVSSLESPELMVAWPLGLLEPLAAAAGLRLVSPPRLGQWSGAAADWTWWQDLVVLERS